MTEIAHSLCSVIEQSSFKDGAPTAETMSAVVREKENWTLLQLLYCLEMENMSIVARSAPVFSLNKYSEGVLTESCQEQGVALNDPYGPLPTWDILRFYQIQKYWIHKIFASTSKCCHKNLDLSLVLCCSYTAWEKELISPDWSMSL